MGTHSRSVSGGDTARLSARSLRVRPTNTLRALAQPVCMTYKASYANTNQIGLLY